MGKQQQQPPMSIAGGASRELPGPDLSVTEDISGEEHAAVSASRTFVGRERELAELCAGIDRACTGGGQLFLVTGDPGIGKTRLTDYVALYAASRGMIVLRAGCWEHDGAPAYWPFIQVLRGVPQALGRNFLEKDAEGAPHAVQGLLQVLRELQSAGALHSEPADKEPVNPELARFRLFDSVATLLRESANLKPLLVVIEDLHAADLPSLMMLRFVVNQLKNAPVMLIGTYRDIQVQSSAILTRHLGDLMREGTHIRLFGLTRDNVSALVEEHARAPINPKIISELHQATAGNPLFVEGIIRVLLSEGGAVNSALNLATFRVPDGVREAIRSWLALLPDRKPLVVAAAIGRDFELRYLQRITQLGEGQLLDVLRQASAIGIVIPVSQGAYRFSHALIRNALYDELNSADRRQLHLQIGRVLEKLYQPVIEMHLAELAHHFCQAGDLVKAVDYSIRAGAAANLVLAYEEAAAHWRRALELIPEDPQERERRADLLERLGELLGVIASEGAEQVRHLEQALRLYEDLGRAEAAARVHSRLAAWYMIRSSAGISPAIEHNRRAQDFLREGPEGLSSVLLYIGLATAALEQMRYNDALTASGKAMDLSERLGDQTYWARAAIARPAALCWSGRLAEAFDLMSRVWARADQLDDSIAAFGTTTTICYALNCLLDPVEAAGWAERELAKPRISRASFLQKAVIESLGVSQVLLGRLAEANGLVVQSQGGEPFPEWHFLEGQLAFYQGEWRSAEMLLKQALNQEFQARRPMRFCLNGHLAARVLRTQGRLPEAQSILGKIIAMCAAGPSSLIEMPARQELALICIDIGRLEQAQFHLARCREILAADEDWRGLSGNVWRIEALLAAAEKRFEEAQSQFIKALETYRHYQVPFEEAETLHYWGRALLAAGQRHLAVEKLEAAIEIYRRHGGDRWSERILKDMPRAYGTRAVAEAQPAAPSPPRTFDSSRNRNQERRAGQDSPQGIFRKEGEYWNLSFTGFELRLRDTKGLQYIAYLLRQPGQEFPVQDLVSALERGSSVAEKANRIAREIHEGHRFAVSLGDAGSVLDSEAREQYRRHLEDLREELESAEQLNDLGRAAKARAEMEFLEQQLVAAVGLHGRNRKTASHLERARVTVTKAVKAAIRRIRRADPELGRHLGLSIRTGYLCAYVPREPISWQL